MSCVSNPWKNNLPSIGSGSFILPDDIPFIDQINLTAKGNYKVASKHIPEPWMGPPLTACLFVLQLNPGFDASTPLPSLAEQKAKHKIVGSLVEPHFGLTNKDRWWTSCFKSLAADIGMRVLTYPQGTPRAQRDQQLAAGYEYLESRVCSVEYFPYGSKNFSHSLVRLPSQMYSFELVRLGIARGATFAVMKGWNEWCGAVPELAGYGKVGRLKGYRGAKHVSPNSCHPDFYESVLETLVRCQSVGID